MASKYNRKKKEEKKEEREKMTYSKGIVDFFEKIQWIIEKYKIDQPESHK